MLLLFAQFGKLLVQEMTRGPFPIPTLHSYVKIPYPKAI